MGGALQSEAPSHSVGVGGALLSGAPSHSVGVGGALLSGAPSHSNGLGGDGKEVGFNILVGGKLGSGGYRIASPLDVFVKPDEAVEVCAAIILLYRDNGNRETRTQNRLAFLIEEWGEVRFRAELEAKLGHPLAHAGVDARGTAINDHGGIFRQNRRA